MTAQAQIRFGRLLSAELSTAGAYGCWCTLLMHLAGSATEWCRQALTRYQYPNEASKQSTR